MLELLLNTLENAEDLVTPVTKEEPLFDRTVVLALLGIAALFGISTWLFFLWAIKDKQFEDVEEIGHRLEELDQQQ